MPTRRPDGVLIAVDPKEGKLSGLSQKLQLAQAGEDDTVYEELLGSCLVVDSFAIGLATSRNAVLHGSDLTFATREHSTQLVLWLAALIVSIAGDARMMRDPQ